MDYYQPVEINVLSAQDLDSVNFLFRPKVYVSVSVTRGSRDQQVTPAAAWDKKLLRWNYRMRFYIEDDKIQRNESVFVFQIKCKRIFGSDKVIGKLFVPVQQLRHLIEEKKTITETRKPYKFSDHNYQVITETGKPKGKICLGFRFGCVFRGQARGYASSDYRLGIWGNIRHEPSAPCEDDIHVL